jgi:hypothetical protein
MKGTSETLRSILLMGAIVICLLALVFVFLEVTPELENSRESQAKAVANTIAVYVNTLATTDAGHVEKDFKLKEPMQIEVYKNGAITYVRAIYDSAAKKSYDVPLLVSIDTFAPKNVNTACVLKDAKGKICIKGMYEECTTC